MTGRYGVFIQRIVVQQYQGTSGIFIAKLTFWRFAQTQYYRSNQLL